jgi:hypothetical protein
MRGAVLGIALGVLITGCGLRGSTPAPTEPALSIVPSPTPFSRVTAGPVQAMVPDGWSARALVTSVDHRGGFIASPEPEAWGQIDGTVDGLSASWVDATSVGVPSDYYYLAATRPILAELVRSPHCQAERQQVLLDRRPLRSPEGRPGPADYVARGHGVCRIEHEPVRWAYFVAAPGFGPVRELGIPASGLYVVVAVVHSDGSDHPLARRLVNRATFGGSTVREIVTASRTFVVGDPT